MGKPVEFADVAARIEQFGPLATLVTVSASGAPHVGTVTIAVQPDRLGVRVGPTTRSNVLANPAVSLTWIDPAADYQLIIDGDGAADDDTRDDDLYGLSIEVTKAILHRRADRPDAGPSCIALNSSRLDA